MEDEEEGLGHALVVHDAEDGVGMDPSEHVVDGELVVDHRGGWGPPVGGHPEAGAGSGGPEEGQKELEEFSDGGGFGHLSLFGEGEGGAEEGGIDAGELVIARGEDQGVHILGAFEPLSVPVIGFEEAVHGVVGQESFALPASEHERKVHGFE